MKIMLNMPAIPRHLIWNYCLPFMGMNLAVLKYCISLSGHLTYAQHET